MDGWMDGWMDDDDDDDDEMCVPSAGRHARRNVHAACPVPAAMPDEMCLPNVFRKDENCGVKNGLAPQKRTVLATC